MAFFSRLKHALFGRPIATKHAHHERLPKRLALPVFASDALSSTAYATEEIMRVFAVASVAYLGFTINVAIVISILIFLVVTSYYQTIYAYPDGGGAYIVTRDNLGPIYGKIAGAALIIDYILTVAVSITAGVLAIVSMAPQTQPYIVPIGLGAVGLLTLANLRGAKESGTLFAVPTYTFVILMGTMIVGGLIGAAPAEPREIEEARKALDPNFWSTFAFITIAFKAFSSGCAALTGIEAISDGAGAFREPSAKNASTTLLIMASLLAVLFTGTSWVANKFHVIPIEDIESPQYQTVVSQIAEAVFSRTTPFGNAFFFALQIATATILLLAANTAYADFPRVASFLARDGYLPRQLANLGDRLVFQNGILVLAGAASILILKFQGNTHALIPLYAVGVFVSFTLSQAGMVARAKKMYGKLEAKNYVSLFGALLTAILAIVLLVSKFKEGAWVVPFAFALLLWLYHGVRKHYDYLAKQLEIAPSDQLAPIRTTVVLLVPRLHKGILQAIAYSRALSEDVRAIHVTIDQKNVASVKDAWLKFGEDIPLVILESPFRSLVQPVTDYVDQTLAEDPDLFITVIVPEAIPKVFWHRLLHNNIATSLKAVLGSRRNVVITNVRYFLD